MKCANTNGMKMGSSQMYRNLSNCRISPKNRISGLQGDSNAWPLRSRCSALPLSYEDPYNIRANFAIVECHILL